MSETESVVVSGCGWVTPAGVGTIREIIDLLDAGGLGESNADYRTVPDDLRSKAEHLSGEIKRDKGAWMAALAVELAFKNAAIDFTALEPDRLGAVVGCSLAGQEGMINFAGEVREQTARFVTPLHFPQTVGNFIAGALARAYHIRGPNLTVAGGVEGGFEAIAEGRDLVAAGLVDVVLVGGVERLSEELGTALAREDGAVSEGACFLLLELAGRAAARSHAPLAVIERAVRSAARADGWAWEADATVVSGGVKIDGARCIEEVIGSCGAAAGVAAAALAIGALPKTIRSRAVGKGKPGFFVLDFATAT